MNYIVTKRFKTNAICGQVNLPYGTECESRGGFILYGDKKLCRTTSENAIQFFTVNGDGNGLKRREFIDKIQSLLQNNQTNWDKVWASDFCKRFKRSDHADHWLWNEDFYCASLDSLEQILKIINE